MKCNKEFSTGTNLTRHMVSHDGNKPYVCTICGNAFTQNGSLKSHMVRFITDIRMILPMNFDLDFPPNSLYTPESVRSRARCVRKLSHRASRSHFTCEDVSHWPFIHFVYCPKLYLQPNYSSMQTLAKNHISVSNAACSFAKKTDWSVTKMPNIQIRRSLHIHAKYAVKYYNRNIHWNSTWASTRQNGSHSNVIYAAKSCTRRKRWARIECITIDLIFSLLQRVHLPSFCLAFSEQAPSWARTRWIQMWHLRCPNAIEISTLHASNHGSSIISVSRQTNINHLFPLFLIHVFSFW